MRGRRTWYSALSNLWRDVPPLSLDDFPIPLDFGLGQLSTHKPCITLVQTYYLTINKVHPPIWGWFYLFPRFDFDPNEWYNRCHLSNAPSTLPQEHKYPLNDDNRKLIKVPEIRFVISLFVELIKIDGSLQVRKKLQKIWRKK